MRVLVMGGGEGFLSGATTGCRVIMVHTFFSGKKVVLMQGLPRIRQGQRSLLVPVQVSHLSPQPLL